MNDDDKRSRGTVIGLAVVATLAVPAAGCGPKADTTPPGGDGEAPPPTEEIESAADDGATEVEADDGSTEADGGQDGDQGIPEDGDGDVSNPESVRG